MGITTGILLFDDAEELDFAGPWEVFTLAARKEQGDRVVTIAPERGPVRCAKGLRVLADHGFEGAPELDVVLVPGASASPRTGPSSRRSASGAAPPSWTACATCSG